MPIFSYGWELHTAKTLKDKNSEIYMYISLQHYPAMTERRETAPGEF